MKLSLWLRSAHLSRLYDWVVTHLSCHYDWVVTHVINYGKPQVLLSFISNHPQEMITNNTSPGTWCRADW
jgi:hypothetical protein